MIEIKDPKQYFQLLKSFNKVGMEQEEYWYEYKKSGKQFKLYVDDLENVSMACIGSVYSLSIFGKALKISDGPIFNDNISEKKFKFFFQELKKLYSVIEIDSTYKYNETHEVYLRRSGFIRPYNNKRCPMTIMVDVQNPARYNRNWRRNIKKADSLNLKCKVSNSKTDDIKDFYSMFNEMKELKNISYSIDKKSLELLLSFENIYLFIVYNEKDIPLVGRIVSITNEFSYDIHAANNIESRETGASFYLLDKIFDFLKNKGVRTFDFGRIAPSEREIGSVSIFKEGSNGMLISYLGEWGWYRSEYIKRLLFIYELFVLKIKGY